MVSRGKNIGILLVFEVSEVADRVETKVRKGREEVVQVVEQISMISLAANEKRYITAEDVRIVHCKGISDT